MSSGQTTQPSGPLEVDPDGQEHEVTVCELLATLSEVLVTDRVLLVGVTGIEPVTSAV